MKMTSLAAAAIVASMGLSAAANAATSVNGTLTSANDIASFGITVTTPGTVNFTLTAWPTFDPIISLYSLPSGSLLAFNDDFFGLDSFISANLGSGSYQIDVTSYANFPLGNLGSGYSNGSGYPNGGGFTLTVTGASINAVPEPASWALLIAGFGLTGAAMRRRRSAAVAA